MESFQAHPVPQNVTNFEFHLVGDMTLKQFGYLAAGLGLAYITFLVLAVPAPFLAWPMIVVFVALGAAFAFLPIQERPLDHWVGAFYTAVSKPTKLKFESKVLPAEDPLFTKRLQFYLSSQKIPLDEEEKEVPKTQVIDGTMGVNLNSGKQTKLNQSNFSTQTYISKVVLKPITPTPIPPINLKTTPPEEAEKNKEVSKLPENEQLKRTVELAQEAQNTQAKIMNVEKQLAEIKSTAALPGADPNTYVDKFQNVLTELQKLNEKASDLSHELAVLSKSRAAAGSASAAELQNQMSPPKVDLKPKPIMNLTTFPNVLNGIVTDSKGSYVEGAVVVAHDKQGLPVRALKSNKLGQFIAATPLPNGLYTINVEKEGMNFDGIQVELLGKILNPVVISAKKFDPVIR